MLTFSKVRRSMLNLVLTCGLVLAAFAWEVAPALAAAERDDGTVYTLTNAPGGNAVAAFRRAPNGSLTSLGTFPAGGNGTGAGLGSQGAIVLSDDGRWLFAVNAGSDSISSFAVRRGGLRLIDTTSSHGAVPISLTSHNHLLFVVNAGGSGNIAGFTVNANGRLTYIDDSTRNLSNDGTGDSPGPAQIEFSNNGRVLVVTEKNTSLIDTYTVSAAGHVSAPQTTPSSGSTPFGFAFSRRGTLVVSEAAASALSSYAVSNSGNVTVISGSVVNGQEAACWVAITPNSRLVFTANAHNDTISSYRIGQDGGLTLAEAMAATLPAGSGPLDEAISHDGDFLYQLAGAGNTLTAFAIHPDGTLTQVGDAIALNAPGASGLAAR